MTLWSPASSPPASPTWAPPINTGGSGSGFPTHNRHHPSISSITSATSTATTKIKYQGKRIAQIVKLKPEYYQEYKKCHANVWPEVLRVIKRCNIEDYSIFYDDASHTLFASFKYIGYDYDGDMEKMREDAKVREWWKMTDSFQESLVEGAKSSEAGGVDGVPGWWKGLEEVFYFT